VTTDSLAYCWGENGAGELGIGSRTGPERCDTEDVGGGIACSTHPVAVAGGLRFLQVDVGSGHACGITTPDRRAYCWGLNGYGQLGDGTTTIRLTPVAVLGGLHFRQVSTAYWHTCGVTTDNQAYCWGYNASGQLGDSTEVAYRLRPTRVSGARQFSLVEAGVSHTCGVTTDSRAFCWGNGGWGQLGNGKTYLSFWPRLVAGGLSFRRLTAGLSHTCGETTGNRAYCWGRNDMGQLGDGTTTQRLKPVAVVGGVYFQAGGRGVGSHVRQDFGGRAVLLVSQLFGSARRRHASQPYDTNPSGRRDVTSSNTEVKGLSHRTTTESALPLALGASMTAWAVPVDARGPVHVCRAGRLLLWALAVAGCSPRSVPLARACYEVRSRIDSTGFGAWLTLTALVLPAACDFGPTGPCVDPTDSGACTHHDSTHTATVHRLVATSSRACIA
jgi:Alpha-tubulin suppressor and related RCC1 domain-containing proteins